MATTYVIQQGITVLIDFIKRIEDSIMWPWLRIALLLLFLWIFVMNGKIWQVLGILGWLGSAFAGIVAGQVLGRILNKQILKRPLEVGEQLSAGLSAFGFLFMPALVGSWSNAHLDTSIEMYSLGLHFVWACVGGIVFFSIKAPKPKQ